MLEKERLRNQHVSCNVGIVNDKMLKVQQTKKELAEAENKLKELKR
jgi:hypothetical protein